MALLRYIRRARPVGARSMVVGLLLWLVALGIAACGSGGSALSVTTDDGSDSEYQFRVYSSLERVVFDEDEDPREDFVEGVLQEVRINATDTTLLDAGCEIRGVDDAGLASLQAGEQVTISADELFSAANGSVTFWRAVVRGCPAVAVDVILN